MLSLLKIENFESHKESVFNFVPGVNVIVGSSDSGKSSVVRALRWAFFNKPQGFAFQSHWSSASDVTKVLVRFSDPFILTRKRNKTAGSEATDCYVIGKNNVLTALGRDVPDEVSELLNLSTYNIQSQYDPYFLLEDTPGERARMLNAIVGLDDIDYFFSSISRIIKSTTTQINYVTTEVEKLKVELAEFPDVRRIQRIISEIRERLDSREVKRGERTSLVSVLQQNNTSLSALKQVDVWLGVKAESKPLFDAAKTCNRLIMQKRIIKSLLSDAFKIRKKISDLSIFVDGRGEFEFVAGEIRKYKKYLKEVTELKNLISNIVSIRERVESITNNLCKLKGERKAVTSTLSSCPMCGSKLTREDINRLVRGLG